MSAASERAAFVARFRVVESERDPALPTPKRPHRCPICNGKGTVPAGFYDHGPAGNTSNPVTCKACGGNGIVIA